jgi:Tol biopolymer transport system component
MRHLALATIIAFAIALAPASAALEPKAPTLVFASFHAIDPGEPGSLETVADLFLWRGNVVTRRLTRTTQWEEYPAWSPDARGIAFSKGDPWCHSNFCERRPINSSIWVQRLNGGAARRITRAGSSYIDRSPIWSPDGRTIAFVRIFCCDNDPQKDGIYTITPDGRNQKRVEATRAHALDWSPDGSTIAFLSEGGRVRLLDVESGEAPRLLITNIGGGKADIAWSPQGDKLAIAAAAGIFVVGAEGGRARRVVKTRAGSFGEIAPAVSWAPDGRRLAFSGTMSRDPEARTDVFIVGVNGRGLTRLTTNAGADFDPHWRP